jgi:hypothetical protein
MNTHTKSSPDIPKWSALLVEAVNKPGLIMQAYSAFHQYSIGNQLLALVQCNLRGLQPGPNQYISRMAGTGSQRQTRWNSLFAARDYPRIYGLSSARDGLEVQLIASDLK